jgi:large exoprotein involved in heme utilization and adhesion
VNGGNISASTFNTGNAGSVSVTADDLQLVNGGGISAGTLGTGNAGSVNVTAGRALIDGSGSSSPTGIFSRASKSGNGGEVVAGFDSLQIVNGGQISASTVSSGDAGSVSITANRAVIDGTGVFSGIFCYTLGSGDGGEVVGDFGSLQIVNGGQISASTGTSGSAGSVSISADSAVIDGTGTFSAISSLAIGTGGGGKVDAHFGSLQIVNGGNISASTFNTGNAGSVSVTVDDNLQLANGGGISASTLGTGNAGSVNVTAGRALINGSGSSSPTGIFSRAPETGKRGNGGEVVADFDSLQIVNGGQISASTAGSGDAGSVSITAHRAVKLAHGSGISVSSASADAGDIRLVAGGAITLTSQSSISASAGQNGGNVFISSPSLIYLLNSGIDATAGNALGSSASVSDNVALNTELLGSLTGVGGNFTLKTKFLVLNNSSITTAAGLGQGGSQDIRFDIFLRSNSKLTATGEISLNGEIPLDLGSQLLALPNSVISAETQLQERCSALLQEDFSSFIIVGRGGAESPPDELQTAF